MILLYSRVEWSGRKVVRTGLDSGQEVVNQNVQTNLHYLTTPVTVRIHQKTLKEMQDMKFKIQLC